MFLSLEPRKLFILDAIGALVSSFMLGFVLTSFEDFFGMPSKILYVLAVLAFLFFCYSINKYLRFSRQWKRDLLLIALANTLYSFLTIGLMIYYWSLLTFFGKLYFITEIILVLVLAVFEFKISNRILDNEVL